MAKRTEEGWKKKREYNDNYIKNNMVPLNVKLNKNMDMDIIEYLKTKPSKAQYLKDLIRADMNNMKGTNMEKLHEIESFLLVNGDYMFNDETQDYQKFVEYIEWLKENTSVASEVDELYMSMPTASVYDIDGLTQEEAQEKCKEVCNKLYDLVRKVLNENN